MPKSKNGVSKRAYDNTSTSSPTGDDSSWKKRKSCANSLGKAAEDVSYETRIKKAGTPGNGVMTRSPGPLIDVNGIGRPGMFPLSLSHRKRRFLADFLLTPNSQTPKPETVKKRMKNRMTSAWKRCEVLYELC